MTFSVINKAVHFDAVFLSQLFYCIFAWNKQHFFFVRFIMQILYTRRCSNCILWSPIHSDKHMHTYIHTTPHTSSLFNFGTHTHTQKHSERDLVGVHALCLSPGTGASPRLASECDDCRVCVFSPVCDFPPWHHDRPTRGGTQPRRHR